MNLMAEEIGNCHTRAQGGRVPTQVRATKEALGGGGQQNTNVF